VFPTLGARWLGIDDSTGGRATLFEHDLVAHGPGMGVRFVS
jgi:hypothetical protein